jgi:hypothetical protein
MAESQISPTLDEVAAERRRQDEKWGEQNHPDGTGATWGLAGASGPRLLAMVRDALHRAVNPTYRSTYLSGVGVEVGEDGQVVALAHGDLTIGEIPARGATWLLIALEEVFEALVEDDPVKLRAELVQAAAVLVAWIEAIDRRAGRD